MGKTAVLLGANWNNGANSGSRCSNWNNATSNSNNNIGSRFACEDETKVFSVLHRRYGTVSRPKILWSAVLSCFGEHLWGSGRASSSHLVVTNDAASFYYV